MTNKNMPPLPFDGNNTPVDLSGEFHIGDIPDYRVGTDLNILPKRVKLNKNPETAKEVWLALKKIIDQNSNEVEEWYSKNINDADNYGKLDFTEE